ncbi:hypothetical protein N1F78_09905 [Seonamhaeicola sp. MEBiC1930]|uniref:hypothetical protein n=1 Tax=Seonamhaeicola sp. MEBiC01930 TaxID=2976768 RepID=UPI0032478213
MTISNNYLFCFFLFFSSIVTSQSVSIIGKVISEDNIENIHVINKTAKVFTVTNKEGVFYITAKINDTLQFTSIQHGVKNVIVLNEVIKTKTMLVQLDEQVNYLGEVVVGKILTGDLLSDIENAETDTPINFYDVGIPGYKGKLATQSERRLAQAGEFKPKMLIGMLLGGASLDPIINGISGRTKMLKKRVSLEKKEDLLRTIKSNLPDNFFSNYSLNEDLRADFFFFCLEDPDFKNKCEGKSELEVFQFLIEKLQQYKKNFQTTEG